MIHNFDTNFIKLIARKIDKTVGQVQVLVGLQFWSGVTFKTPVGNPALWKTKIKPIGYVGGRAKHSWNVSYALPDMSLPVSWGAGKPKTPTVRPREDYTVMYVTSSIPYMKKLEDGHSAQGDHMIKRTLSEINLDIKTALR